jgi:hypothetical protein
LLADSMLGNDALRAALSKKYCPTRQAQDDSGDAGRDCDLATTGVLSGGVSRSVMSYRSAKRQGDAQLQGRLGELAAERKRFGYRRLVAAVVFSANNSVKRESGYSEMVSARVCISTCSS